jgi:hypothetical protein
MIRIKRSAAALSLALGACLSTGPAATAAPVTSEGWDELSANLEFYIEVPMIDNKDVENYGVGGNITAEAIINSVRYAGNHPGIHHVVFKMDTGGGALHHAEAMEDIIEEHHQNTEFHIVVQNAISAGIWTAFSCDTIFMCDAGTIGGATAYYTIGDTAIVAGDIPWIAGRLELTAERNGYPPQLIKPLMLMESELHYWVDKQGEKVLSNTAPKNPSAIEDHRVLDRKNNVLTLTSKDAIEIGIAKPIEAFDTSLVGEKIGVPNWTLGNRYGMVTDEIGWVYNTTRVWEDNWVAQQLALPQYVVTSTNRSHPVIKQMLKDRKEHAAAVDALRSINEALNELPNVHPERHLYVAGPDGITVLAEPDQWAKDAQMARALASKLTGGLSQLTKAYKDLGVDRSNLDEVTGPIRTIAARITWIANKGNAKYWLDKEAED